MFDRPRVLWWSRFFYFLDFGDPGCEVWIFFFCSDKTMVLIHVIVENVA